MLAAALLVVQTAASSSILQSAPARADHRDAREFVGIWLDEFEGTQFFEGASDTVNLPSFGTAPALAINRAAVLNAMLPPALAHDRIVTLYPPHLYRIRFVGRIDPLRDCRPDSMPGGLPPRPTPPGCIGVGGSFPARIEALRVIELVDLGPLPPSGQPVR